MLCSFGLLHASKTATMDFSFNLFAGSTPVPPVSPSNPTPSNPAGINHNALILINFPNRKLNDLCFFIGFNETFFIYAFHLYG